MFGDYDDEELLLSIKKISIETHVDENFKKLVSKEVVEFRKNNKNASQAEVDSHKSRIIAERASTYEAKKSAWLQAAWPPEFLAFVFCSYPGKRLTALVVLVEAAAGSTKYARKAIREATAATTANSTVQEKTQHQKLR